MHQFPCLSCRLDLALLWNIQSIVFEVGCHPMNYSIKLAKSIKCNSCIVVFLIIKLTCFLPDQQHLSHFKISVFFSRVQVQVFKTYTNILLLLWKNSDIFLQSWVTQQLYTILQTILFPSGEKNSMEKNIGLGNVSPKCFKLVLLLICVNYTVKIQ